MATINVESFKSNSHKSKNEEQTRRQKIKAPVAKAKTQKKSLRRKMKDIFISSDATNAKEYLIYEIIVPSIKETIVNVGNNALELIFGVSPRKKKNSSGEASYAAFYKSSKSSSNNRDTYSFKSANRYFNEDVIFKTRGDAEDVLDVLIEALTAYGNVTVADFKDAIGVTGDFIDNQWGWVDLKGATIKRVRDGYLLVLPEAVAID